MSVINGRGIFAGGGGGGAKFDGVPGYYTTTDKGETKIEGALTNCVVTGEGWLVSMNTLANGSGDFGARYELDGVLFPGNHRFFIGRLRPLLVMQKFYERAAADTSMNWIFVCAMGEKFEETTPFATGLTGSASTAAQPIVNKIVTGSGWITHISEKYENSSGSFTYSAMALKIDGSYLIGGEGYRFSSNDCPIDSLFRFKDSFEFCGNGEIIYTLEE